MITIPKQSGERVLELGGGGNRHSQADVSTDIRPGPMVDFPVDLEKPFTDEHNQAISSEEFDWVISIFAFEHVSYPKLSQLLSETYRVIKSGGKLVLVVPNTEAQAKYILSKPEPDGDESCMLFGQLDYPENSHKSYWSPATALQRLTDAGFESVLISPFGNLQTDMVVQATKPGGVIKLVQTPNTPAPAFTQPVVEAPEPKENNNLLFIPPKAAPPPIPREKLFGRKYFDGSKGGGYNSRGFYWDYPQNWMLWKQIMNRKPESVLELGCGRGYVLKRLQDFGVSANGMDVDGMDISSHCYQTRACNQVRLKDVLKAHWDLVNYDLCFSYTFLEHVPEADLPVVFEEMRRTCNRGLHGITLEGEDDGQDPTRCTVKSREWWQGRLPRGHEVFSKNELAGGNLPPEAVHDSGLVKANIGSYMTMSHNGWFNTDVHDLNQFAVQNGYRFIQNDATKGLQWKTGEVDCIVSCHMLEHLSYSQGLSFLKDCRRVIKPSTGVMRILVPDAELLTSALVNEKWHEGHSIPTLGEFDEVSGGCANAPTSAMKLAALLWEGHQSVYDEETLCRALTEAKFKPVRAEFRKTNCGDLGALIVRETLEMHAGSGLSLQVEAVPVA